LGAAFIAFMVARGWGGDRLPPRCEPGDQDAGDHEGPPAMFRYPIYFMKTHDRPCVDILVSEILCSNS